MSTAFTSRPARWTASLLAVAGLALGGVGCGGSGGTSTGATLPGVVLISFLQSNQDNVPLNRVLEFRFSSPINPNTVNPDSIQVRVGPLFGQAVAGRFVVQGDVVLFEPQIPGLCDLSDSGLKPNQDYRVTLVGNPETFAIRNLAGDPLAATITQTFHTRSDTDPELFEDQEPGQDPTVVGSSPLDGAYPEAGSPIADPVIVQQGNKVTIDFSENLQPCTLDTTTVLFFQYATGDVTNGFVPKSDQTPGDPYSWGSGTLTSPPTRVRATFSLEQTAIRTRLTLTPTFGEFPDNALLVVSLTNGIKDLGNNPLIPYAFSFVTQNRPVQTLKKTFEFTNVTGDFVRDDSISTGDVNTSRSPSKVQGWLLFAGDGDNGSNTGVPSGPENLNNPVGCSAPYFQANDGNPDDFDPQSDVNLNTGASLNTCTNTTDGSKAVVFEFRTFRIKNGVTVRLTGNNPAIILVSGDINIESGARLLARGDGSNGAPNGTGGSTTTSRTGDGTTPAGTGVAGGGNGGAADGNASGSYSFNGAAGYGSPDFGLSAGRGGADPVRVGPGRGNVSVNTQIQPGATRNWNGPGGGGGGHASAGTTGSMGNGSGTNPFALDGTIDGAGGGTYGDLNGQMLTAEAGSGGGGGGAYRNNPWYSGVGGTGFSDKGGSGGAGGGFIDFTAGGDIRIFGEVDAAGGMGGAGVSDFYGGGGGGGGGSGGGIRILTPNDIALSATTKLSAAGGNGGAGGAQTAAPVFPPNPGGTGGLGRIVLEDSDSVITGLNSATVAPNAGSIAGFRRDFFDPSRFKGGGLRPVVVSQIIDAGPASPTYLVPAQDYLNPPLPAPSAQRLDFIGGIPQASSLGLNRTAIFIEAQGYDANPDGTVKTISATGWKTVGYFKDSGNETTPTWTPSANPGDVSLVSGNTGGTIASVNGKTFIQFRVTFFLKQGTGPFDPGAYMDRWDLYFQYNQ